MNRQPWLHAWAERFARELAVALAAELRPRRRRTAPPPATWPTRFKSYADWRKWCRQDDEDEMREMLLEHTVTSWETKNFEALISAPVPVIPLPRFCAECGHVHGGRAYGVCLTEADGQVCSCNLVRSAA